MLIWTDRSATRRSPRKNERRPVYVLNVTVPPRSIDNCLEPAKSAVHFEVTDCGFTYLSLIVDLDLHIGILTSKNPEAVSSFVSAVVQSFLVRHGFYSDNLKANARAQTGFPSPRKKRKIGIEDVPEIQSTPVASCGQDGQNMQLSLATSRQQTHDLVLTAVSHTYMTRPRVLTHASYSTRTQMIHQS